MKTDNRELLKDCLPWVVLAVGMAAFCWLMYLGNRPANKPESFNATNAILTEPGFKSDTDARFKEWWEGAPITNDPYVIVFRAIEARYTSDTNGPSTYTAYVPNGPALQMVYSNQASPVLVSITLYMTNLTAFSNRLTIY